MAKKESNKNFTNKVMKKLPVHDFPSPVYPALQIHSNDPNVFLQNAFASQLCDPIVHSSMSEKEESIHTLKFDSKNDPLPEN